MSPLARGLHHGVPGVPHGCLRVLRPVAVADADAACLPTFDPNQLITLSRGGGASSGQQRPASRSCIPPASPNEKVAGREAALQLCSSAAGAVPDLWVGMRKLGLEDTWIIGPDVFTAADGSNTKFRDLGRKHPSIFSLTHFPTL